MTSKTEAYFIMPHVNPWDSEETVKKAFMFLSVSPTPEEAWSRFLGRSTYDKNDRASGIQASMDRGYHLQLCEITY